MISIETIKEDIEVCNEICLFLNTIETSKLLNLIPEEILSYFYNNCTVSRNLIINLDTFNFSDKAKAIIAYLSYNYFFDEEEKTKTYNLFQHNEIILEKEKLKEFNPDDLFKSSKLDVSSSTHSNLPVKRKNMFECFIAFFKKFHSRNN